MIPVSFAQRRLWFLDQVEGSGVTYNIPVVIRLRGDLDATALRAAMNDLVGRHEALRTVFHTVAGEPMQRILPVKEAIALLRFDRVLVPAAAMDFVVADATRSVFDLSCDLLIRGWIFATNDIDHVLVLVVHHVVADGWSMYPLLEDLGRAYAARRSGRPPEWAELPVQYADYTLWQRELLGDPADPESMFCRQLAFWRNNLSGAPEELSLPVDRYRPAVASSLGGSLRVALPAELHERLLAVAHEAGASLFMLFQTALAVLYSRLGAGDDIPLGTVTAGRPDAALEDLVGFFVNTLVLRTDVTGDPTLREAVVRTRESDLKAFANQDVPFEALVEELNPTRSLGRHPLFQTMLVVQNNAVADLTLPDVESTPLPPPMLAAKFDLALDVFEVKSGGLVLQWEYSTDLFDPDTVGTLAARFLRVLEVVGSDLDTRVSDVDVLLPGEAARLVASSDGDDVRTPDLTVPHMFSEQVKRTPDAVAVMFEDSELTYRELDERAFSMAQRLAAHDVGPDDIVGVCLPRSPELIVAFLGIHRAGAAYLPLDPEYPAERLGQMLDDARPTVVVVDRLTAQVFAGRAVPRLLVIDEQPPAPVWAPVPNPHRHSAAYVIFTSGSTGRPKGVTVTHGALASRVTWMRERYRLSGSDTVLQFATTNFDTHVEEIFPALTAGASVLLVRNGGPRLPELLRDRQGAAITVLDLPTAYWHELASMVDEVAWPDKLRLVILGGEALSAESLRRWTAARGKEVELINTYGPTETTVIATAAQVVAETGRQPTIGRPIGDTQVFVLDDRLRMVPIGVPGEVYIAGAGLARGYLRRPGLTAGHFVACPFGRGRRMYRTGDIARRRPDGGLEFVGRADDQVKVRGFRVELGEIEATLARLPGVAQCAVSLRTDQPSDPRLVGYVVPSDGNQDPVLLRTALAEHLPAYMLPAVITLLERLPLTASGKVDRAALPAPVTSWSPAGTSLPRTELERLLCELLAEVLGIERIGPGDNFFEYGGHSLLAVRLITRIRTTTGFELTLRDVFDAPTPAELAARCDTGAPRRPAVRALDRGVEVPASFQQRGIWIVGQVGGADDTYNIPMTWELSGDVDVVALRAAVEDVVRRHESLRTAFSVIDGQPVQRVRPEEDVVRLLRFEHVEVDADDIDEAVAATAAQAFDLAADLLLRGRLLAVSKDRTVLLLVVHHIAADGWSMRPLLADVGAAYAARRTGRDVQWTKLRVQYPDYALWQRHFLGDPDDPGSALAVSLRYWCDRLAGVPAELMLPTDRPRPEVLSRRGGSVTFALGADLHGGLATAARERGATLFMLAHAGLAVLLYRRGAGTDIPLGTVTAGRDDEALGDVVGLFVNTVVLRTDLSGTPTFDELLGRIRDTDLTAFAHHDVPFELLVDEINPPRSTGRHPLVQVMLVVQNQEGEELALDGLEVRPSDRYESATAKFDLTVSLTPVYDDSGRPAGITGWCEYSADLFDPSTVTDLMAELVGILGELTEDGSRRVGAPGDPRPSASRSDNDAADAASGEPDRRREPAAGTVAGDELERRLCVVLAEVLGVAHVSLDDDFFGLGGNSLAAVRLVARIREEVGMELPIRDLFRAGDIGSLARGLRTTDAARPALRGRDAT